ncbi:MAG: hypothetical protein INQ03_23660 [Candidatus Heimdallarchaeota archaeon]|nr:hypothetical protein [Candidatus Heimdallarchaeota archaeon]
MISQNIREWTSNQQKYPSLFIYQNTPMGIFTISDVIAGVRSKIEALEWLCLSLAEKFTKISRIEVSVTSGLHYNLIDDQLERLVQHQLLKVIPYDKEIFLQNLSNLELEFGNDWKTPMIQKIINQDSVKQYTLNDRGEMALEQGHILIEDIILLPVVITGNPFSVFNIDLYPRPNTYKEIDMNPDLVGQILTLAKQKSSISGIDPIGVNATSQAVGKNVIDAQIWISMEESKTGSVESAEKAIYLTSPTFDRWGTPPWDPNLLSDFPEYTFIKDVIVVAISSTYEMAEEIIADSIIEENMVWKLVTDLEMATIIYQRDPDLFKEINNEISLSLPNTDWKVSILLQLDPYFENEEDFLALNAIRASRFHSLADRKGFTKADGYHVFKKIMTTWKQENGIKEYEDTLDLLCEYNCLSEQLKSITTIVVDLDDILGFSRRDTQSWSFSRIDQVESILNDAGIKEIIYIISDNFDKRIDNEDQAKKWLQKNSIQRVDNSTYEVRPSIMIAMKEDAYYLGNRSIPKKKEFKALKSKGRQIKFSVNKNQISIPDLNPFYEWRMGNILELMYDKYY